MDMLFLSGFGLGIAIVASPGAVTTQAIRRGLSSGFMSSFILQVGAIMGLLFWAFIGLIGIQIVAQNIFFRLFLGIGGGLLLIFLAKNALQTAYNNPQPTATLKNDKHDFMLGIALSLANPLPMILWMGIANDFLNTLSDSQNYGAFSLFVSGFFVSALLWSVALSIILRLGHKMVSPRIFQVVNLLSAIILSLFAIKLLWGAVRLVA